MNNRLPHVPPAVDDKKGPDLSRICPVNVSAWLVTQPQTFCYCPQQISVRIFGVPTEAIGMTNLNQRRQQIGLRGNELFRDSHGAKAFPAPTPFASEWKANQYGHPFQGIHALNPSNNSFSYHNANKMTNNFVMPNVIEEASQSPTLNQLPSQKPIPHFSNLNDSKMTEKALQVSTCEKLLSNLIRAESNRFQSPNEQLHQWQEKQDTYSNNASQSKFLPLRNLRRLYFFLVKFFRCEKADFSDLSELASHELEILNLILLRKYETRLFNSTSEKSDSELLSFRLGLFQSKPTSKRIEENFKFIFTRGIKHLKKIFRLNCYSEASSIQNIDYRFFGYYFEELVTSDKESFESFVEHSINKERKSRGLNLTYFRKVFSCKKFMEKLMEYLGTDFEVDFDNEIERKCLQLLLKWDPLFSLGRRKEHVANCKDMNEISKYLLQNKRCKLPWTLLETRNAISRIEGSRPRINRPGSVTGGN